MAAARYDVSAVVAHSVAALEQERKGRFAREAELWGRAVEAARALGAPDCLVLASARLVQAEALLYLVDVPDGADVEEDARFTRAMDLVHAAAAVLERRRIAGTLLYGKCAPHEEEWSHQMELSRLRMKVALRDANIALLTAPFVGYEAYLAAARLTLCGFTLYRSQPPTESMMTPPGISVVASALDLMGKPRPHENISFPCEAVFVNEVRRRHLLLSCLSRSNRKRLLAAWDQLQSSGVIVRRDLERAMQTVERNAKEADAKAQADADALGLRSCAHCSAQEVHVAQFKHCAACKDVGALYCSKECQRAAWPTHKAACKAARNAAAGGAAADA